MEQTSIPRPEKYSWAKQFSYILVRGDKYNKTISLILLGDIYILLFVMEVQQ